MLDFLIKERCHLFLDQLIVLKTDAASLRQVQHDASAVVDTASLSTNSKH